MVIYKLKNSVPSFPNANINVGFKIKRNERRSAVSWVFSVQHGYKTIECCVY